MHHARCTVKSMINQVQPGSAAQSARLLLELCGVGLHCLERGMCVGLLRATDVQWDGSQLTRTPSRSLVRRWQHLITRSHHNRTGHDECCYSLGVPFQGASKLLLSTGGVEVELMLMDGLREAVAELQQLNTSPREKLEIVKHQIGGRISFDVAADRD